MYIYVISKSIRSNHAHERCVSIHYRDSMSTVTYNKSQKLDVTNAIGIDPHTQREIEILPKIRKTPPATMQSTFPFRSKLVSHSVSHSGYIPQHIYTRSRKLK